MKMCLVISEVSNSDRQYLFLFWEISDAYTYQQRLLVILIIDDYFLAALLLCCSIVVIVILGIYWLKKKNKYQLK